MMCQPSEKPICDRAATGSAVAIPAAARLAAAECKIIMPTPGERGWPASRWHWMGAGAARQGHEPNRA